MATLSPKVSSKLAADIYLVQNKMDEEIFFERYASFIKAASSNVMHAEVGSRLINTRDAFGVACKGAGDYENDVFLIFRGSTFANYGADWISNARIGLEIGESDWPVHTGFNHIFKSMLTQLKDFFASLNGKPRMVHCVGHSLGGAIATLASDWVSKKSLSNATKVYTFGAPRPATHLFSKSYTNRLTKNNIYRVYHESDPVPMIPVFPFCHSPFGNMAYLIHTKPMIWPWDHKMGAYIKSIEAKGRSWASLSPTGVHEPTEAQMQQWLESGIKVEPRSTTAWQWVSSALFYVLRKIVGFSMSKLQATFTGIVTLADSIALLLQKGLDNDPDDPNGPSGGASRKGVGYWITRLMIKIMQILGWSSNIKRDNLTRRFMQNALQRLVEKSHLEATKAVQTLTV
ncbi:MAG TPA: lipase family protein [Marinagarivorans sp.]